MTRPIIRTTALKKVPDNSELKEWNLAGCEAEFLASLI